MQNLICQLVDRNSLQLFCDSSSCVLAWVLIIFTSTITFIITSKDDECDNHNFNFYSCWKVSNMNYSHKISLSHSAVFQHYHMNENFSILISQKCLLIHFLSVLTVFSSETLPAFRHVILVKSKVKLMLKLMLKLDLILIRCDIYFCLADNFFLTFSLQFHEFSLSLSASKYLRCSSCLWLWKFFLILRCDSCQESCTWT